MNQQRLAAAVVLGCGLVACWFLLGPPPAGAHAVLVATEPADGEQLDRAPEEVVVEFNEEVQPPPEAVRVFDAAGRRVDLGDAGRGRSANMLRVGLPPDLPDGVYTVSWRAISADTHPVRGGFLFVIGDADSGPLDAVAVEELDADHRGLKTAAAVVRWLMYLGASLAAGLAAFLVMIHDRRADERRVLVRATRVAALVGAVATVLSLPVQAALTGGTGVAGLVDAELLSSTATSGLGASAAVRLAGLGLVAVAIVRPPSRAATAATLLGATAAVAANLLAGHTATSEPRGLVLASNLAHSAAAAVWFGGLVALAVVLRRRRSAAASVAAAGIVSRFSVVALVSVAALVASGTSLGWVEVRELGALTTSAYGQLLLAKVAVVAVVVAVAAYNNRWLVPAVRRHADHAAHRLRRTVQIEAGLVATVLALTAVLVATAPPRAMAEPREAGMVTAALGDRYELRATVEPARAGVNELSFAVVDAEGRPIDAGIEASIRFTHPERDIAPVERMLERTGAGRYRHTGPELAVPGRWTIEFRMLITEFQRVTASFDVDIDLPPNHVHNHHHHERQPQRQLSDRSIQRRRP